MKLLKQYIVLGVLMLSAHAGPAPLFEDALTEFWSAAFTSIPVEESLLLFSGLQYPLCNTLLHNITKSTLEKTDTFMGTTSYCVLVEDTDTTTKELLINYGLDDDGSYPDMVLAIKDYQPFQIDNAITIERITTQKQLDHLHIIDAQAFNHSIEISQNFFRPFFFKQNSRVLMYLGYYQDEPAAIAVAYAGNHSLFISTIAVKPEFRRKGLGQAMVQACIMAPEAQRAEYAILQALIPAIPLYKKMGFKETRRLTIFIRSNAQEKN